MRGWLLTFHLVGVVLWMGGLLVLARLLAYHAVEPPSARGTLSRIEARLNYLVAVPGALVAIGCGVAMMRQYGLHWLRVSLWMHVKLLLVLGVVLAHAGATIAQRRVARRDPNEAIARGGWRMLYAVLGLLLIAIMALAVQQPMVGGGK